MDSEIFEPDIIPLKSYMERADRILLERRRVAILEGAGEAIGSPFHLISLLLPDDRESYTYHHVWSIRLDNPVTKEMIFAAQQSLNDMGNLLRDLALANLPQEVAWQALGWTNLN